MTRPKLRIGLRTLLVVTPLAGMLLAGVTDWIQRPTILPPQKMLAPIRQVGEDGVVVGPTRVDVLAKLQKVANVSPSAVVKTRLLEQRVDEIWRLPANPHGDRRHARAAGWLR